MYITKDSDLHYHLSDGKRVLTKDELIADDLLADQTGDTGKCGYLNSDRKIAFTDCSAEKKYLCEFKGAFYVYYYRLLRLSVVMKFRSNYYTV